MKHRPHNFALALIILSLSIIFSGCTTLYNPATERKESYFISPNSEVAIGKDMDAQIRGKYSIVSDPLEQERILSIGRRIAVVSDRQDIYYTFTIVKDKTLNAFATPGGFVYIHSGLMREATDDELAGVIAHEIGHIAARHSIKRLQTVMGYQLLMGVALGMSNSTATIGQAMDVVFGLVNLGYARGDEYLADKLAVKYAHKAGFNPRGMVSFFEKLKAEGKGGGQLVFLSSHPPIEERITRVQAQIAAIGR
jgi:beta-barrel assembly-enhancing protease